MPHVSPQKGVQFLVKYHLVRPCPFDDIDSRFPEQLEDFPTFEALPPSSGYAQERILNGGRRPPLWIAVPLHEDVVDASLGCVDPNYTLWRVGLSEAEA